MVNHIWACETRHILLIQTARLIISNVAYVPLDGETDADSDVNVILFCKSTK